jgi:KDO2-lipid IV(A) lauroyltransferase
VVVTNLQNAFPEKSAQEINIITKGFYKSFCDIIVESIKALTISEAEMQERVRFKNIEVINEYLQKNVSIIGICGHNANWEWLLLGACLAIKPFGVDAVYKKVNNNFFENLMYSIRSRFGGHPIEMNDTAKEIIKRRKSIRGFAMVADQVPFPDKTDLWITFLNQETGFFTGVERIAKSMKYPVIFLGMKRIKRGFYEVTVQEISAPPYTDADEHVIIAKYADALEKLIKEKPSDWLWSHRRWKHKRPTPSV